MHDLLTGDITGLRARHDRVFCHGHGHALDAGQVIRLFVTANAGARLAGTVVDVGAFPLELHEVFVQGLEVGSVDNAGFPA